MNTDVTIKWGHASDGTQGWILPPVYENDAGLDMMAARPTVVYSMSLARIVCGIRIALPDDVAALVVGRSSAAQRGLMVFNTLIDPGYRGDMFIIVLNLTRDRVDVNTGDRLAQLVPIPAIASRVQLVFDNDLPPSDRSDNGFGSSGGVINAR